MNFSKFTDLKKKKKQLIPKFEKVNKKLDRTIHTHRMSAKSLDNFKKSL